MNNTVYKVVAYARIVLNDGTEISLKTPEIGVVRGSNFIKQINISKSLSASNNNPIGVPCSAQGDLVLISEDKSLQPENTSSIYYGKMNSSAILYLSYVDDETEEGETDSLGIYYVEDWYSSISSNSMTEVTIQFNGIMSFLNKSPSPNLNIEKDETFVSYLTRLVTAWNITAPQSKQLTINSSNISFGEFSTMPYSDIDGANYGELLAILSQSTLTNIYISNNNEILTDYYFDDVPEEAVCTIDDCVNAYQYNVGDGLLVKYKGVKVNYSSLIVNDTQSIANLTGQTLTANGDTTISNIDCSGNIFKLNYIKVKCDEDDIDINIVSISYNKKYVSVVLNNPSQNDVTVSIEVFGQTINNSSIALTQGQEPMLEVTNNILSKSDCYTFVDNLYSIIDNGSNELTVEGYFNPRLELGDIVYVDLTAIDKEGYYKIHRIDTNISDGIKTTLTLYSLIQASEEV